MTGRRIVTGGRLGRACALLLAVALIAGCGASGATREEVRAYLDSTYEADVERDDTWSSTAPVGQTADQIAKVVKPGDRFTEEDATFMRNRDYIVAVFPESSGSRVEYDTHERMHNRYPIIIGGFWGRFPGSYGPRGAGASRSGGGFRGGGPGVGK